MKIIQLKEPQLIFGSGQTSTDPRDGLMLFGPYQSLKPYRIRAGIVSTKKGLDYYRTFVSELNKPIVSTKTTYGTTKSDEVSRPSFPGFESVFNIEWSPKEEIFCKISKTKLTAALNQKNKSIRVNRLVELYLEKIIKVINEEDSDVNIWFIIVPRSVYKKGRPNSYGSDLSKGTREYIKKSEAGQGSLQFDEYEDYEKEVSKLKSSKNNFHHLLKARLIQHKITTPVQLFVEPTLQFRDKMTRKKYDQNIKAHLAWTQSTTLYYKLGKLPWKLHDIREGVCYVGLVFKKFEDKEMVCSAAQMFLNDGDGSVFRGNIGLWESEKKREHHLDEESAEHLLGMALDDYKLKKDDFPKELFVHGRAYFSKKEWKGFKKAIRNRNADTKLTGVLIKEYKDLKLFRDAIDDPSNYGVLRGTALITRPDEAFLFTNGYVPRLKTATSLEVPVPLKVNTFNSDTDIETVLNDIMALTKLNYNACVFADGVPVTLKFSDNIGNILTATSNWKTDRRQFKYYI